MVGLSPRGRGNQLFRYTRCNGVGSIPAWAGQPFPVPAEVAEVQVYPRVGGATNPLVKPMEFIQGLSPRGRGNPALPMRRSSWIGSIPAWAGQPVAEIGWEEGSAVYPRVGGATGIGCCLCGAEWGLSPRGRGNPRYHELEGVQSGSIPAWAGQPTPGPARDQHWTVYPRVGGATPVRLAGDTHMAGLSPRGRGNLAEANPGVVKARSIPAWAGQPGCGCLQRWQGEVYPRVGGATRQAPSPKTISRGLSPRGRGNLRGLDDHAHDHGSIPAWAGQPTCGT